MDDIWVSIYSTAKNIKLCMKPTVYQDRNVYNLIKDFKAEYIGYTNTLDLINDLKKNQNIKNTFTRSMKAFSEWKEYK